MAHWGVLEFVLRPAGIDQLAGRPFDSFDCIALERGPYGEVSALVSRDWGRFERVNDD